MSTGVSQEERERAKARSRRMYQTDLQSDFATAEDRGEARGIKLGVIGVARNLLSMGLPMEQIIQATGLTRQEIEKLQNES